MDYNIVGTYSPAISTSNLTVTGITTPAYVQGSAAELATDGAGYMQPLAAYVKASTNVIYLATKSGDSSITTPITVHGTMKLASKPSFVP
jgi:hypothetical protein